MASCIRPRVGGGAVVALENGIGLARQEDLSDLEQVVDLYEAGQVRTNEGGCDPDGRFWIGTMAWEKTPGAAGVYRWDGPGAQPELAWGGATIANGLGWSPDGSREYWIDTRSHAVSVMDYDAATGLGQRHTFVEVPREDGSPDGLTLDAEQVGVIGGMVHFAQG
ncbi:SMP-30/gluconolactonase/LRE family protein [Actinomyces sp. MRS3W]|uniref:SMP-30/gluconolactonase/LRE family protein n=1 Tax=Actinomyces sp. MRS3W TaxID=2800796 RepID=UPI0028FDAE8F|nr:SMP-30/gluconolactonase/LRE family protein [Actinomyces sp. MRS3W]MDU0348408.1 SMP-30/gluconolactonase/LRE family protein [Actinomyces sp. MRS3W]